MAVTDAAALHQRLRDAGVPTLLMQPADVHGSAKGMSGPLAQRAPVLAGGARSGYVALGPALWREFVCPKHNEWHVRAQQVTPWELGRYAELF